MPCNILHIHDLPSALVFTEVVLNGSDPVFVELNLMKKALIANADEFVYCMWTRHCVFY